MKTIAVFLALAIAYVAIDSMPTQLAGAIGLAFIFVILATLVAALIAIGKRVN
jgi:hypothetical protein